ncbi:hypothetical protein [Methanosarcina mazei]|uniref:hypothetical protein n=1 Tax=Methanosarcina mazei TaxID=2209 RepID=UPI00064FA6DC|nr:hypothetical protein [Methanosarcina mazei]
MASELNEQGVSLAYCKTKSRLCRGFWEVLNGVPIETLDLKPDQKEKIKKYMQASINGKSIYQISQEVGVSSFCCGELHKTKKQHRRAFFATSRGSTVQNKPQYTVKQSKSVAVENELLNFLKSQKSPICASVCAKGMGWQVYSTYYMLKKMEKKGKVRREKKNSYTKWEVTE